MKNWLGHEIEVGAIVFRGGRQGDSSSFRIGLVDDMNEEKRTARVQWYWVPGYHYMWDRDAYQYPREDPNAYQIPGPSKASTQRTRYPINELVRVDDNMLDRLARAYKMVEAAKAYKVRQEDYDQFEVDFMMGLIPEVQ